MNLVRQHSGDIQRHHHQHGPQRTCIGCRAVDLQENLTRFTYKNQKLFLDQGKRKEGRGAYVHAAKTCLQRAEKGGWNRSFRTQIPTESIMAIHERIFNLGMVREGSK